jgi:hypothetical protein
LARNILHKLRPTFTKDSVIYDPACGAGNLLIAAADYIQDSGISFDGQKQLLGTDLHKEFIEATKLRLATNFLLKQPTNALVKPKVGDLKKYQIKQVNGLAKNRLYSKATHIIVNPPFNQITFDEKLNWAEGKVSAAALFIDKIIQNVNPGVTIIAILPDVLRSGTRYEKWRELVKEKCIVGVPVLFGQFDKYADVDVYAITFRKKDTEATVHQVTQEINNTQTIKDLYDICVGPVVDNRDPFEGPSRPYLVSKGLEGWLTQSRVGLKRKHKGKKFEGPFVVVKRTSRRGDKNRATATIINPPRPIYVDNHLIILKPKSGTMADCKRALRLLKDERTNSFLDEQIRCRHLTVKVVANIPIWEY